MKENIGTIDRYLRLTAGFYLLGAGIKRSSDLLMIMGSMKIAEGITKWCPMLHVLNMSTNGKTGPKEMPMPDNQGETQIPVS